MKITQEEVVDRQTVLHIELEDEDMVPYLDRGYSKVAQRTTVPGFRKGKAPRPVIERYVGRENLIQEALDYLLPDVTVRAIEAQELEATGHPDVELLDLDPVTVKATVALAPFVDLGAYRDSRVEEPAVEISEDDVQERVEEMRKAAAPWEPVERAVSFGDMVTMDVVGHVEEAHVIQSEDSAYVVEEDSALPFPGFAQNLPDMEVGAPKEFHLDIPEDNVDARLAGKEVHFTVTVKEVKERNLPELDDEFAKGVGDGYESLAELRETVESDVGKEAEQAKTTQYREAVLDRLVQGATFEFPPMIIDHEVRHMVERRDRFVDQLNVSLDAYLKFTGKSQDEIQQEMREHAVERFSRSYALATLAESEGLDVSDQEIEDRIEELKSSNEEGNESEATPDLDSDEVRGSIRESLLVAKAMDRLVSIARGEVTEAGDTDEETPNEDESPEEGGGKDDSAS